MVVVAWCAGVAFTMVSGATGLARLAVACHLLVVVKPRGAGWRLAGVMAPVLVAAGLAVVVATMATGAVLVLTLAPAFIALAVLCHAVAGCLALVALPWP